MALKIGLRRGTASNWTSINPVLSVGEAGVEYDTGQFKIGDGSTVWSSLAYKGATGPTQTKQYRSFGDGSDGNVTITSGTTTLTRDMFYNNLTLSGTGSIFTNGFKVFIKGNLDITSAGLAAINNNGSNGGDASGLTGGSVGTPSNSGSLGAGGPSTAGVTGTTAAGVAGTSAGAITGNGGVSNSSGAGGTGTNAGGVTRGGTTPTSLGIRRWTTSFSRGVTLLGGGAGGPGGGSGGGDGINNGGGGGAGGTGGGVLVICANNILKSSSTIAGTLQTTGGNGGQGGNSDATGVTGGGGGGAAGAGGWVYLAYNSMSGPIITDLINTDGGAGGNGGNGFSTGLGGQGGAGGYGGRINVFNIPNGIQVEYDAITTNIYNPQVSIGTTTAIITGGHGGLLGKLRASL